MKIPTLVVGGALTPRYFSLINEVIVQCILGSRLVAIPKATHLMSHQNPTAFNEAGAIMPIRCRALQHNSAGGFFVQQWCPGPKPHA